MEGATEVRGFRKAGEGTREAPSVMEPAFQERNNAS
jgi:hypothetical protein